MRLLAVALLASLLACGPTQGRKGAGVSSASSTAGASASASSSGGTVNTSSSGGTDNGSSTGSTGTGSGSSSAGSTSGSTSTSGSSGAANRSAYTSQVVPAQVEAGSAFTIQVTLTNTGDTAWTQGYALGSQDPQDNLTWGTSRAALPAGASVAPGEAHTFDVALTAPAAAGTYPLQWQMVQEGVEWFGDRTPEVQVAVTAANPVPAANHAMLYGYYFADGRYGDSTATVWPYTNTYVALPRGYDTSQDWHPLFAQSLQNATAAGKSIYLAMDAATTWDDTLTIVAPYWDNVQMVEVMAEAGLGISDTEAAVQDLKGRIQARGLSARPMGVLYGVASSINANGTDNGWLAPSVDFVGIETYLPAPGDPDPSVNAAAMQAMIANAKAQIPAGKDIVFATMSYDRNGGWTDASTLAALQLPQYLGAYQDGRVRGLLMFDWGRPGGAQTHPELQPSQQQIGAAIPAPALPYVAPGTGPVFTPVTPTFRWDATYANGWFPRLSPDGSAVAFGQGDISYADLAAGTEQLIESGNAYSPAWIRPGVFTYLRDLSNNTANRIEVSTSDLLPVVTADDPSLVAGNVFVATDGHWASYLAGNPHRVASDGAVLGTNTGGALSIGEDDWVAFADTNDQLALDVWHQGQLVVQRPAVGTPLFDSAIGAGGYILYGGHGPVHGITPAGVDSDLTIAPGRYEGVGKVFLVGGQPWVATNCWEFAANTGYVLLRPFGETRAVIVSLASVALDVVVTSDSFVIASNDDQGHLTVVKVPLTAPLQAMQ